jgi:hypothetical protein
VVLAYKLVEHMQVQQVLVASVEHKLVGHMELA